MLFADYLIQKPSAFEVLGTLFRNKIYFCITHFKTYI